MACIPAFIIVTYFCFGLRYDETRLLSILEIQTVRDTDRNTQNIYQYRYLIIHTNTDTFNIDNTRGYTNTNYFSRKHPLPTVFAYYMNYDDHLVAISAIS